MPVRFAVTGSGRCGTTFMSRLLDNAGVKCGHEDVFHIGTVTRDEPPAWNGYAAASSWMAVRHLPLDVPVVLVTRHPLAVVRSYVEIGYFDHHDADNPCHEASRRICPDMYAESTPQDRALHMWIHWNETALAHAELRFQIERLDAACLERLLRWAGYDPSAAAEAFARTAEDEEAMNHFPHLREQTGITWQPGWHQHRPGLAVRARRLAALLGYDPDVWEVTR